MFATAVGAYDTHPDPFFVERDRAVNISDKTRKCVLFIGIKKRGRFQPMNLPSRMKKICEMGLLLFACKKRFYLRSYLHFILSHKTWNTNLHFTPSWARGVFL